MSVAVAIVVPEAIVLVNDSRATIGNLQINGQGTISGMRYHIDGTPRVWVGRNSIVSFTARRTHPHFMPFVQQRLRASVEAQPSALVDELSAIISEAGMQNSALVAGYEGADRTPQVWHLEIGNKARLVNAGGSCGVFSPSFNFLLKRLEEVAVGSVDGVGLEHPAQKVKLLASSLTPEKWSAQQAIDFGMWYVRSTCFLENLNPRGEFAAVGGPLDVSVLTCDGEFRTVVSAIGSGETFSSIRIG